MVERKICIQRKMIIVVGKSVCPLTVSMFTGMLPNTLRNLTVTPSCGMNLLLSKLNNKTLGENVRQACTSPASASSVASSSSVSSNHNNNHKATLLSTAKNNFLRSGLQKIICDPSCRQLHTSSTLTHKLHEFFDDEKNWSATSVSTGRSWAKNELRTRSNQDLHKLWYVLLKEMNMLLTMKAEFDRLFRPFPAPERLEKVEVSMDNLQDIVAERNRALSLLETGELPHPKWIDDTDELDRPIRRLEEEHLIPKEHNEEFLKKYDNLGDWTRRFKLLWNEKERKKDYYYTAKSRHLARKLLEKYPDLKENPQFLNEYCMEKVRPVEENPDVEKLIKEHEERND